MGARITKCGALSTWTSSTRPSCPRKLTLLAKQLLRPPAGMRARRPEDLVAVAHRQREQVQSKWCDQPSTGTTASAGTGCQEFAGV